MSKNTKIIFAILLIVTVGSLVTAVRLSQKLKSAQNSNPSAAVSEKEVKDIVASVGKAILLPQNETPTVATVIDPSKLRSQPFFNKSEIGDQVLIYANEAKAILWRPSSSKIIEVSAIVVTPQNNATGKTAPAPTAPATK